MEKIKVRWDDSCWAWSYAGRDGLIGGDIGMSPDPDRAKLSTAARAAVYADRALGLTMGQVADLRVVTKDWPWTEPAELPHLADMIDPRD